MHSSTRAQFPDENSPNGAFQRQEDTFRGCVTRGGERDGFPSAAGRYHLYISWACPWAHRVALVRRLKGLEHIISMSAVDPIRDERGWAFRDGPGFSRDPVNDFAFLSEAYQTTDPNYVTARYTVPVLWDRRTRQIVSNSDDDLMRMLNAEFNDFATEPGLDLYPPEHRAEIDALNARVFETVNDGVYRAGFASSQAAYEAAVFLLFDTLDFLDGRLAGSRFLFGYEPLETDWHLFVTLVRFDAVYHGHFKCNLRRIVDYRNLSAYLRDLYQQPGVAGTVNMDHIKRHYYVTHGDINPTRIVPAGPVQDLAAPHGRERLSRPRPSFASHP